MKEMEFKFLVTKEKFYEIKSLLSEKYADKESTDRVQINYYYDNDEGYLLENHTTVRVRQIEDRLTLEVKEAQHDYNDYTTSNEYAQSIDSLSGYITLSQGRHAWIPFTLQGSLITRRFSLKPSESLSIDFDISQYFGRCDYEIEMEFEESALKATLSLIESLNLMPFKNMVGGKARRFFACRNQIMKQRNGEGYGI